MVGRESVGGKGGRAGREEDEVGRRGNGKGGGSGQRECRRKRRWMSRG